MTLTGHQSFYGKEGEGYELFWASEGQLGVFSLGQWPEDYLAAFCSLESPLEAAKSLRLIGDFPPSSQQECPFLSFLLLGLERMSFDEVRYYAVAVY